MQTATQWRRRVAKALVTAFMAGATALAWSQEPEFKAGQDAWNKGDVPTAMALLRKPADANYAPAQSLLAYILNKAEYHDEALAYYNKAAAQNDAEAYFGLGSMYAAGEGVKRDLAVARKWFTQAAEKGHGQAIRILAQAYAKGGLGIPESERTSPAAIGWIKRAADEDSLPSLQYLAKAYRTGGMGVDVNLKEADRLDAKVKTMLGQTDKKGRKKR